MRRILSLFLLVMMTAIPAGAFLGVPGNAFYLWNRPILPTAPGSGECLVYSAGSWGPASCGVSGGITSLNGLTAGTQTFAVPGTSGLAPAWVSSGSTHTLNIPMASAAGVTAGLISKASWDAFTAAAALSPITAITGDGVAVGPGSAALVVSKISGAATNASFVRTATISSATAATAVTLLSAADVSTSTPYITHFHAKVNGSTPWATTSSCSIQDDAGSPVSLVDIPVAAMTANAFITENSGVTLNDPYVLGTGLTATQAVKLKCDANGTGSDLVVTISGALRAPTGGPADIANLKVWYDGDDLAYITKNGSNLVSAWLDKSGNGFDLAQSTTGLKPTWTATALNGRAGITFGGGSVLVGNSNPILATGTGHTIFAVVKVAAFTTGFAHVMMIKSDAVDTVSYGLSSTGGYADMFFGAPSTWFSYHWSAGGTVIGTPYNMSTTYNGSGAGTSGNFVAYSNTVSQSISADGGHGVTTVPNLVGAYDATGAFGFNGPILEIIDYSRLLTSGERATINSYLSTKWGI